jgi:nicotinate-nucleotide adenylyltransferase
MSQLQPAIGILGGTFDPIHNGHLHIATKVLKALSLTKIRFVPSYQPVHRELPQASVLDRVAMVKLAIKNQPDFCIDQREAKRKQPSYTIDTLISLRQDFATTPFCLILGMDVYLQIATWKNWRELLNIAHFVVVNRPNYDLAVHPDSFVQQHVTMSKEDLHRHLAGKIFLLHVPPCAICATVIRGKIKAHENISKLVPEAVASYIYNNQLYL